MKYALLIFVALSLSAVTLAQTNQQPAPVPQEGQVIQRQIVELPVPKRGFRPKMSLQRGLKLAERYIEKRKIDMSSYYLLQAKYILYGSGEQREPCWFFWWVNENGAIGDHVEIIVSIETGKVWQAPSM